MFSLICVWIKSWVNNRNAGDLRRYRAHYDVIVMSLGTGRYRSDYKDVIFKLTLLIYIIGISCAIALVLTPNNPLLRI